MKLIKFVALVVFLVGIPKCSARLREYEESCNIYKATENCRPDLDLVCHDDVCACKDLAFYDTERKACVAQIGEACTAEQNTYGVYSGSYPTISRCPLNTVCEQRDPNKTPDIPDTLKDYEGLLRSNSQGSTRCLCKRGFYPSDNKQNCILALEHGETCSKEIEQDGKICDSSAGLICGESGVCTCNDTETTHYDDKTKRCLTRVDDACSSSTFCEKNSICSTVLDSYKTKYGGMVYSPYVRRTPISPPRKKDDANATKNTGKCTCLPGYTRNAERKCVGSFSVACSTENPCNSDRFLACVDGICQCQAGSHQAFSSEDNSTCVLLPGSSCHVDSGPKCVANSVCSENGHCQCKTGFSESPSGKCLLSYENECVMPDNRGYPHIYRPQSQQGNIFNESCNYYQGLSCKDNKCECFDSQLKWDAKKRMCIAEMNERCGSVAMMRTSEFDYQREMFYPTAALTRRYYAGNFAYINSYFVACAEGLACTKAHNEIEGWRVCEKKA